MFEVENRINCFLLQYCRLLVADIPDDRMAEQPVPGVNHPAWILGHLAYSANAGLALLGTTKIFPTEWEPLFAPASKVTASRSNYPSKEELIEAIDKGFALLRETASNADDEHLSQPTTNPRMKDGLPEARDRVAFLLTGHLGVHLGQLSSWRRMIGLPPMF